MSLILGGAEIALPAGIKCVSWLEHGMTWRQGENLVKARTEPVVLGVVHCTAAERGGQRFFHGISLRGYSVEFHIDALGCIWQFLDPLRFHAAHIGGLNARAVGVEVQNVVYPIGNSKRPRSEHIVQVVGERKGPYPQDYKVPRTGPNAGKTLYYQRSNRQPCTGLWPKQAIALRALGEALVIVGVPFQRIDTRDYIPNAERTSLAGWIGHVQATLGHADPSLDAMEVFPS